MSWIHGSVRSQLGTYAKRILIGGTATAAGFVAAYRNDLTQLQFDTFSAFGPFLRLLDAESSHNVAMWTAKHGIVPRDRRPDITSLGVSVWGREFPNPIGLAAGFDKDADGVKGLLGMGFGFVEVGTITPLPQPGNPKPRCFRLPELGGIINRYGFNSLGVDAVSQRLEVLRQQGLVGPSTPQVPRGLVGVNLGKNKTSEDAAADYSVGVKKLGQFADYLVINISSPNTPGLRALQGRKELEKLVKRVKNTRDQMQWGARGPPPLLIKLAPDLTDADKSDIATVCLRLGVDGLVVSNTTITRPGAVADHPTGSEVGGLSGKPLLDLSTAALADMYRLTKGKLPIIGCGGVSSGEDAYRKIRAGATLVQLYTALAYEGPSIVPKMKQQLAACLEADGFTSVQEAVGVDHLIPQS
ncbi:Dihydroorotate dehydrogenase (fumarate) [Trebouxia sp. C0010 RCD-2024]